MHSPHWLRPSLSRRLLLGAGLSALLAPRLSCAASRARFIADPFSLGVASGWPVPGGISLWTRLAPAPLAADGGMGIDSGVAPENIAVTVEIARDEAFSEIVRTQTAWALPELGHSVHIDLDGLEPGRWYFYRFFAGDAVSPIGRTRMGDALDAALVRLKFAIGSCQHYERGWYTAYRHLLAEELDLMLFLGDYIYEASWGMADAVRRYAGLEPVTLTDYRIRHAQHKTDPDLQRLHGAVPWVFVWDDHEVDNDWAADRSEHGDPAFLQRREAAFQAYFEHMPIPMRRAPTRSGMRLYEQFAFGDLARFYLLDDRQHRSPHACPDPSIGAGSSLVEPARCAALDDPARTMLGAEQEAWLEASMKRSGTRWNFLAQQTLLAPQNLRNSGSSPLLRWTDGWDGYPIARKKLLSSIRKHKARNPVVLGGDMHATYVADLRLDPEDGRSEVVATEFCGTSITSDGMSEEESRTSASDNPHLSFVDGWHRGYLAFELTRERCTATLRGVDIARRDGAVQTVASFVVEDGRPGAHRS